MKLLFVINPISGGTGKEKYESGIREFFKDKDHQWEWYAMNGQDDVSSLKYYLESYAPDRVVAVGGDGTLKFLAENLLHTGIPIAFLPAGSANGMARELCLPPDIPSLLSIAVNGTIRKMDALSINGHISIHLSDIGLNAQLVKYFEEKNLRGMLGYGRQVLRVMVSKQQMSITVQSGGAPRPVERKAWMLVFANARKYGTGTEINPEGDLYDGKFELVLFKRLWFWEMIRMLLRHRRFDRRKTEIVRVEKVRIELAQPAYFQVDGEYIGMEKSIDAHVERGAVTIVT